MNLLNQSAKYVITGGPGFGKTALIEAIKKEGFYVKPEAARAVIEKIGKTYFKLDPSKRLNFQRMIFEIQLDDYRNSPAEGICFFDRGLPDNIAYLKIAKIDSPEDFLRLCQICRYRGVFVVPPWREIYAPDSERKESYEEAVKLHSAILQSYEDCDYEIIELPRASVEERVKFIKSRLSD